VPIAKIALAAAAPGASVEGVRFRSPDPVVLLLVAAVLAALVLVVGFRSGPALSPDRASWTMTPGVLNPDVTQATIGATICRRGWTRTIRPPTDYTNPLKLEQMKAYDRRGSPSDYQEDHLISLGLGGHPTDPRNLWPEPQPLATRVDRIEVELNAAICSGRITLAEAQRRISRIKHTTG
jgi:hypothetical protein